MRDSKRKKLRDLRQSHLKGMGPCLRTLFVQAHPEYDYRPGWRYYRDDRQFWDICSNEEDIWIRQVTGLEHDYGSWCHPPKCLRREMHKIRRAKVRQAMIKINAGDYDCHIPEFRKDIMWTC